MRDWLVGGAVIESAAGVLLVQNRRRNGSLDWTPPGGVIDDGETLLEGLTREVAEETGLEVARWAGPLYRIEAEAAGLGWRLTVEAYRAVDYEGELWVDDPDGIVVDACFVPPDECSQRMASGHPWVREPLADWLTERWDDTRGYGYRVDGTDQRTVAVSRR